MYEDEIKVFLSPLSIDHSGLGNFYGHVYA
jgi:hypothetical protein